MNIDVNGIYDRLQKAYEVSQLKELSRVLGYSDNWASKMKQRGTIPYDAIVQTADEKNIPLDYLVYGADTDNEERDLLKLKEEMLDLVFALFNEDDDMPDLSASQSVKLVNALIDKFK